MSLTFVKYHTELQYSKQIPNVLSYQIPTYTSCRLSWYIKVSVPKQKKSLPQAITPFLFFYYFYSFDCLHFFDYLHFFGYFQIFLLHFMVKKQWYVNQKLLFC